MSIKVMSHVWRLDLPPSVKLVALALADHAHDDGTEARPSRALLVAKTGLSKMTLKRAIDHLVAEGIIRLDRPSTQHYANVYAFNMTDPRGNIVTPLVKPQRYQLRPQRSHGGTPEVSPRDPNHKEPLFEPRQQALADEERNHQDEQARVREVELYGHVLTVTERARLMRSVVTGRPFVPDAQDVS